MATAVVMPRQGNTVESCLIAGWKKKVGEQVSRGEVLCEIETDKALMEVEAPASGVLLALFFEEGADVPVLTNIAAIGRPGEDIESFRPASAVDSRAAVSGGEAGLAGPGLPAGIQPAVPSPAPPEAKQADGKIAVSPRARNLAQKRQVEISGLQGTGPGGRIIERDVQAALEKQPPLSPLARAMAARGEYQLPARGSGVSGRIMATDLKPPSPAPAAAEPTADEIQTFPVKGIRKVIAARMLESLQTTAQLTLNASANARALLAYRQRLKQSDEALGLQNITVNDLILFTVSRILPRYPNLNALFKEDAIYRYKNVHLGFAVDTPRGLIVPVIRQANALSLKQIAQESKRLTTACLEGSISPDEMSGGTFTVTNLGSLGIETFTPILNPPQVGILGIGTINLKPIEINGDVRFVKHIGLSLTVNHQVVDGAPAARFLQAITQGLAEVELLLAL